MFTRFYDTLVDIVHELKRRDSRIHMGTYSGQGGSYFNTVQGVMINLTREEVKERFLAGEIDVLICTDAAAEGLNLQTADLLINFDLPWNPMKVEQRIGRIDRIGQKHEHIYVENLCYAGSAEETVYGRLLERLRQASLIVGSQQLSLLPLDHDDFSKLAEHKITLEELQRQVEKKIKDQQRFTRSMQIDPADLYSIYVRLKQQQEHGSTPITLDDIWDAITTSSYLAAQGGQVMPSEQQQVYLIKLEDMPDVAALTISRNLYEAGIGENQPPLHFATYGDSLFETIIKHMDNFTLPDCVQRLTIAVPGMVDVKIHAYAAACIKPGDAVEVRLICSYLDIQDIELAENYTLNELDIEPLYQLLESMVREEFAPLLAAASIERDNVRAARAQEVLNYMAGRDLIEFRASSAGDNPAFWPVMREVSNMLAERPQITINNLPADILRTYQSAMLFDYTVPRLEAKASVTIPRMILESASAAVQRMADSERGRKRDLKVSTILRRLQVEADKRQREL